MRRKKKTLFNMIKLTLSLFPSSSAPNPLILFSGFHLKFPFIFYSIKLISNSKQKLMSILLIIYMNLPVLFFLNIFLFSSCDSSFPKEKEKSIPIIFSLGFSRLLNMGQETRRLTDEYEISEVLGRGGFSVVRRGIRKSSPENNTNINSHVAIKTLKRLGPNSSANMGGFPFRKQVSVSDALLTNEILVMRKIVENVSPHENVIDLYDVFEDQNGVHLVLELCSGGELFDRIVAQERYTEAGAAAVVLQIAKGLGALHRANVVHRDLKPENCLFLNTNRDSPLKIMDFGLSSVEEFTDPVVGLFGSIDYVSPEALSQGNITSKSDMWSLGVILYILLSGYVLLKFSLLPNISV